VKLLVFLDLLTGSVWAGGLVAIGVAAQSARRELAPDQQIAFFRTLGRSYLRVGGSALIIALACGMALLTRDSWNDEKTATVGVAAALIIVTALAVVQARALARIRDDAHEGGAAQQALVANRARRAGILRAGIGILTLAELALAAALTR
jgi:hypothetical protein